MGRAGEQIFQFLVYNTMPLKFGKLENSKKC